MRLKKVILFFAMLGVFAVLGEENNPCLHNWSGVQYNECNTSLSWGSGNNLSCSATTSFSSIKDAALARASKSGTCKKYRQCTKCGERDNLPNGTFGDKSATCTSPNPLNYEPNTSPSALYPGSFYFTVRASCHTERSCSGYIYVDGHNKELSTPKGDRRIQPCYMTGRPPHSQNWYYGYASIQSLNIPLGTSQCFNMNWDHPTDNNLTNGKEYFKKALCTKCSVNWTFSPESTQPGPGYHLVEKPIPTGGGTYQTYGNAYTFLFDQIGSAFKVKFLKKCKDTKVDIYGWNPKQIALFPCTDGTYDYTIKATGVQQLTYSPTEPQVYFKEIGAAAPKEKTLYVLSEIKKENEVAAGNKERAPLPLSFSATATGESWPSVHPVYGGFNDSELTASQITAKNSYKYPTWQASHLPYCYSSTCKPDHYEFSGDPGSSSATFKGKAVGRYSVAVQCGTESNPADPNDNYGVRRRFIHVCNPVAIADFQVTKNSEDQKVIDDLTPCNAIPIAIVFGADLNYAPEGDKAKLTIDADPKSYELYKDPAGTAEAGAEDLEVEIIGSQSRKTVYLLPIKSNENTLRNDYKIITTFSVGGTQVKADDKEDYLTINWREGGCSGGMCRIPPITANNGSVLVQASFGQGAWGKSGGSFQVYAKEMNYRLLDNRSFESGVNPYGRPVKLDPMLRFSYGNSSTVKVATEADETANSGNVAGYPIRVRTGQYCTEFTYRKATVDDVTFVDKVIATQYLSTDTNAGTPMPGGSTPVAVNVLEIIHGNTIPANADAPEVSAFNVTNTQYVGSAQSTRTWQFTQPETVCPDLTGDYTISQLSENGVNNILVKQNYTQNSMNYRREIRYIGSMTAPVSKEDKTYCNFPWGEELISETAGGATTTYEYFTEGNGRSKLQKITYPQGNTVCYEYNTDHDLVTETETRGSQTIVTSFEYAYDTASKKRTSTTTRRAGAVTLSKNKSVVYEVQPNSSPDESIRYDENGAEYVTRTWYTQGPNGTYDRRPSRQENPDGTRTMYSYVRSGNTDTTTTLSGVFSGNTLILGTRQVSVSNNTGTSISNESWFVDTARGVNVKTASSVNSNFDAFGRAQTTTYLDGSTVTRVYGCCGVETETDRDGSVTHYSYDDFKRLSYSERDGITTFYTYDAIGNQTGVTVKGRNDGELSTASTYHDGNLVSNTDAMGHVISYARSYATDGANVTYTETTTNPDASTAISVSVNGESVSSGGTAQHAQSYSYGADWQMSSTPVNADVNMTVKSYSDMLGRNFKTEYADGTYSMNYYNAKSQLVKSVSPGGLVTLLEYDTLGRQIKQAIDMNGNGTIDAADLTTSNAYTYGTQSGKQVAITTVTRSQNSDNAVISTAKQSVDGLESWTTDLAGLTTHSKTERLSSGNTRQTVTQPDGSKIVTNMTNGRITTVQVVNTDSSLGKLSTYSYDEFNRVAGVTETHGANPVNTMTNTYNANGATLTTTVNGQTTAFEYDVMGRQTKVTAPGGVITNYTYYPTGELQRMDGATYPVEYTYNGLGQQATLTTYQDASTPQVTSWAYNNRGLMVAKTYADGNSVTYTYNADGQLLTRTWARQINGEPLTTTYSYDAAGRQTGYSYSDGITPAVSMTLNHLDQPTAITDAAGTRNFTYNAQKRLANETNPSIVNGVQNYTYDTYGRRSGMTFGNGTSTFANAAYTYDTAGRIATVGNGAYHATYAYTPANLLHTTTVADADNTVLTATRSYDNMHRLTGISTNGNGFGYTYNAKNQRVTQSLPDANSWIYTYDNLGQVVSGNKQNANAQAINGWQFSYWYDLIGNRTQAKLGSSTNTVNYTANLVNQYTTVNTELPTYDTDGNMLTYNGWTREYDGENRLIAEFNSSDKFDYVYDYKSRRIESKHYTIGASDWTLQSTTRYVWDDWNIIAELVENNNNYELSKNYLWGLYLSGSLTATGGVGALLAETNSNGTYFAAYDGNGNITAYLADSGTIAAEHAYDPFLNITATIGSTSDFTYQASTKRYNPVTGILSYQLRDYDPALGRWTTRDPIEEQGGVNLYGMADNNPIYNIDFLGLEVLSVPGMSLVYDIKAGMFREPKASELGKPGSFISGNEARRRIEKFSFDEKKKLNKAFGELLHKDSPYKIKLGNVTSAMRTFTIAFIKGAGTFASEKFCLSSLTQFQGATTRQRCACARDAGYECAAIIALEMGTTGLVGAAAYIYGEAALQAFFEKLYNGCVENCSQKRK